VTDMIREVPKTMQAYIEMVKDALFEIGDLRYMQVAQRYSLMELPFRLLLEDINRVHREGLDETGGQ